MASIPVRIVIGGRHRRQQPAVGQDLEHQLQAGVRRAARYYDQHHPGRGEYELVRLAIAIAHRYGDLQSAEVLADLRFNPSTGRRVDPVSAPVTNITGA